MARLTLHSLRRLPAGEDGGEAGVFRIRARTPLESQPIGEDEGHGV